MDIMGFAVLLQLYSYLFTFFLFQISSVTLPLSYSILPSSCPFLFELGILFFPFLSLDSIPYSYSSLYPLRIIFLYHRHLVFPLSYNILILFPPLLIFAQLSLLLTLLWFSFSFVPFDSLLFKFYLKPHITLLPFLTPFCHHHSMFYLCFKFYFLPFFALFLFHTLIISPSSSGSKSFFYPLVISYSLFPILFLISLCPY